MDTSGGDAITFATGMDLTLRANAGVFIFIRKQANSMSRRGISFNSEMVKAIIDGSKTTTRRPIRPQPTEDYFLNGAILESTNRDRNRNDVMFGNGASHLDSTLYEYARSPYGQVKDVLWVRETFCYCDVLNKGYELDDPVTVGFLDKTAHECVDGAHDDGLIKLDTHAWNWTHPSVRWRPSGQMPRWASRIRLRITDVRIERVQDISEQDAKREGVIGTSGPCQDGMIYDVGRDRFRALWNSIYNAKGLGWDTNPWVWVYDFERIK